MGGHWGRPAWVINDTDSLDLTHTPSPHTLLTAGSSTTLTPGSFAPDPPPPLDGQGGRERREAGQGWPLPGCRVRYGGNGWMDHMY